MHVWGEGAVSASCGRLFHTETTLVALGGRGSLEGDVQSQAGAAIDNIAPYPELYYLWRSLLLHTETKSVLLRTDAMVMRPSIALGYVTAWSKSTQ